MSFPSVSDQLSDPESDWVSGMSLPPGWGGVGVEMESRGYGRRPPQPP